MKKRALLAALVGTLVAVITRRGRARRVERELWNEAGTSGQ